MKIIQNFVFLSNTFLLISGNLQDSYSKLRFGYRLDRKMIDSYTEYSILDCVEECLRTTRCKSVSYYKGASYCEISYKSKTSAPERYKEEKGWIYSEREDWDPEITGSCSKVTCNKDEKCIPKSLGNYECILSDCGMPPFVFGADSNSLERWDAIGIYRQIHLQCHKYIFKKKGSGMLGCSTNGNWTINLSCDFQEVWLPFKGHLYMVPKTHSDGYSAKQKCEDRGGFLAEIESKEENNWIKETYLVPLYENQNVDWTVSVLWIGGNCPDRVKENCTWIKSNQPFTYDNWHSGDPNGDGPCVYLAKLGVWNDYSCSQERYYICEKYHASS